MTLVVFIACLVFKAIIGVSTRSNMALLPVKLRKPFSVWPFRHLFLKHALQTCELHYANVNADRATFLSRIELFADVTGCEEFAFTLLRHLVQERVLKWQTAIEDEACLRLPVWQRFKDKELGKFFLQLQGQFREVFQKLKALEFTVKDCKWLSVEKPFQQAARAFHLDLLGFAEFQDSLRKLMETRRAFKVFHQVAAWHGALNERLQAILQDVKHLEACWDDHFACDLVQQCQPLRSELPHETMVKALDGSMVIRDAVLEEMATGSGPWMKDVAVPKVLENIQKSWMQRFQSLVCREMALNDAQRLLQIGERKGHKIGDWLRLEVSTARALGEGTDCDSQQVEADLTALSQFARYATVLSDLQIALTCLQKRDILIEDKDLKQIEKQLHEHKNLKWNACKLRNIGQYSKSQVLDLEVCSSEAAALHEIVQQETLIQLLVEGLGFRNMGFNRLTVDMFFLSLLVIATLS